jgi:polyisoprenoid-binding protein YceI
LQVLLSKKLMKMKKIILSMLTLSTIAFSSCGEKDAETEKEVTETKNVEVAKISGTYNVAESSVVTWSVRHYKDTAHAHTGTVAIATGSIVVENGSVIGGEFEFDMTKIIEPGTDTTQPWTLQRHLATPDYFNTGAFATSTFTISSFTDGMVTGNLEVIGVSKEITFPAEVIVAAETVIVSAEFDLNLLQFGLISLVEGDALPEAEKMESPNPTVTFQLDVSASKAAH